MDSKGAYFTHVVCLRADQVVLVDNMFIAPVSRSWVKLHRARPSGSAVGTCYKVVCGIVVHSAIR